MRAFIGEIGACSCGFKKRVGLVACVDSPHAHIISSSQEKKMSGVRSLRNELREFVLENVEVFGDERVLGTGSYGSVQEVRLEQLDTE